MKKESESVLKKLFKAIIILTSFSVLTRALGFLFRIILSRALGAEGLGVYQIAFSIYMVLETFISSGLPLCVSKQTSKFNKDKDKNKEYSLITAALIIGLITAISLCLIIFLFKHLFGLLFTDKRCLEILLTLLPSLIFASVYSVIRGNFWGKRKYFLVSFTEFIEQVVRLLFCVIAFALFYSAFDGVFIVSTSLIVSCFISSLLTLIIYLKQGGKFKNPKGQFKTVLKTSTPITLVRIISSLLSPIISVIVPFQLMKHGFSNSQALSIFGIAMGMTFPLLYIPSTVVGSLSMTLIPDLSIASYTNNTKEIKNKIDFSIKFGLFIAFLFIPLFMGIGKYIGIFLYDNAQAGNFLTISSWLVVPICTSGITVSCLNALNLEVKGFINYFIGAIFLVLSIVFLTGLLGIISLAVGMGLCLSIATILNIMMLNKKIDYNFFNFKYLFKLIITSIPSVLMTKWTFNLFNRTLSIFFSLCFSGIIGELFFLSFALIFNLYNFSFLNLKILKKQKAK